MAVTADEVLDIIAAEAKLDRAALKPEATLTDLEISSIDVVSVVFELEDRFGLEIEPESIEPTFTIAQFTNHIVSLAAR
jgi:acyl carrier protein